MGRSTFPTYAVRYIDQTAPRPHTVIWNSKTSGQPTQANLEKWRKSMNASMKIGGCNEHVSKALGFMPHISMASIVNQKTNTVIVEVVAPMFEVI